MNSENSKASMPHILKLKLTSKLDLRISEKVMHYRIVVFITRGKI